MGPHYLLCAIFSAYMVSKGCASELAPVGFIPDELIRWLHPEQLDEAEHPGFVERSRRASGSEEIPESEPLYTLYSLGGAPCILAKTDAKFILEYRTLRHGSQAVEVNLPKEPMVSGSCVREGDTAVLTMTWSVFNFSLAFKETPEGDKYYLNTAILKYNQSLEIFKDATYRGNVITTTRHGLNYYFTPMGKSYICRTGEDQGPLHLYNVDDELIGNMTMYNTKFQPFVKRAKGDWGPEVHCLPLATQIMRDKVVPYITSLIFIFGVTLIVAAYGIYRYFHVKKTDYGYYDEGGEAQEGQTRLNAGEVPLDEMPPTDPGQADFADFSAGNNDFNNHGQPQAASNGANGTGQGKPPASNPFKKGSDTSSNPFNQGYGSSA